MKIVEKFHLKTLSSLIALMGKRKKLFAFSVAIYFLLESLTFVFAKSTQLTIVSLTAGDYPRFLRYLLLMIAGYGLWWIFAPIATYAGGIASKKTVCNLRTDMADHVMKLPMKLLDTKSKGELLSAMTNDVSCIERIYDSSFSQVMRGVSEGVSGMIAMFVIDWRFALVVFVIGSISTIASSSFGKVLSEKGKKLQAQLAQSSTNYYELIKAYKTISLLKIDRYMLKKLGDGNDREAELRVEIGRSVAQMESVGTVIQSLSYTVMLALGALFVYWHISDWGTVIALIGLKSATDRLYIDCANRMASMQRDLVGGERVLELARLPEESLVNSKSFSIAEMGPTIAMQDVSFAYQDRKTVLKDVSVAFLDKALTALMGESGSGKSTVAKLILALYEPDSGVVQFSGREKVSLETLRMKTAYVPQDAMLIRGTVFENIVLGNENATMDDVVHAARLAEADVFIREMEKGYDTMILDDGKGLSGGQRQRIAIARALVKNAPILLLDEITSSLDSNTARQLRETILKISRIKTVLFISHDPKVAAAADAVYVVEGRRVKCVS